MSATPETRPTSHDRTRASADSTKNGIPSKLRLDIPKIQSLPSEQQDLYLFTFALDLERFVYKLGEDELSAKQSSLNHQLLQIIGLLTPTPTRVIRKCLGRCFERILGKGDRRSLYDSINQLVSIVGSGKGEKELPAKHAAVHCLGEIYKTAGESAISLSILSGSTLMRLFKIAQKHVGLRGAILTALGKIAEGVKLSIDEGLAREIWKYARVAASTDKAALVQQNACSCLEKLIKYTIYFDTTGDYDNLKSTILKACESASANVRRAAASCLASVLVKSYSEQPLEKAVPKLKKPKKSVRSQPTGFEDGEETISRPGSPSTKRNASKLEFSLPEIFRQLSVQYVRSAISNRTRVAIIHCYIKILKSLDAKSVASSYGFIADHLLIELSNNPFIMHNRHRLLLTRKFVQKILAQVVGSKILGESGRFNAARVLINDILKNYPQVIKEREEPSKHTLIGALDALAALISSLGSAFAIIGDNCREALLQVLQHLSYSVQIHASHCLRVFVLACPQQFLPCASICMNSVTRELVMLTTGRQSSRRCVGFANGLAAVLSISPLQPLYSSLEISTRVLSTAISLLKSSSRADLRVSSTQIQVAWILMGGLMSLGPNFVKIHISQLLLLWRNALPRPLTAENTAQRQASEIIYLTHVRECALGAILSFLEFNNKLITVDVSKRIAAMLHNTVEFLESLPIKKPTSDDTPQRHISSLQLQDLILMVRRRVLQCYTKLISFSPLASSDVLTQSNLVTLAVSLFADPEVYAAGSLGSSIVNSAGNFENIWEISDNSGFGICGLIQGPRIKLLPAEPNPSDQCRPFTKRGDCTGIDENLLCPINGALEHDSVYIHIAEDNETSELPDPPATEVVNSAITLFAIALPLQNPKVQEGVLEQMATHLSSNSLQRDPGRKAAITANAAMALLGALKVTLGETHAERGDLRHPTVERYLQEILRRLILDPDRYVRNVACEGFGRLCNNFGNHFTTNEINNLIDTIVSNRDPNSRAACATALGSILSRVGGMAAGYHLKKIHGILMSLCSDPSSTVHHCAIEALSLVADSAGLTFSGYVPSTLGLLAQLWTCDTHNEESGTTETSNYELDTPTRVVIARCVDSLINVLGPDLQDMSKTRELMLTLIQQCKTDDVLMVQAEGLKAMEHLYLYDAGHINFSVYVCQLQVDLGSPHGLTKDIAIDGLYNIVRRDAKKGFQAAKEGLDDQIWLLLNENPEHEGIRNIVQAWLGQTSLTEASEWIARCQHVLTKTAAKPEDTSSLSNIKISAAPDLQDEEVAGFAVSDGKDQNSAIASEAAQELLRWQVRVFVLRCLSDMITAVGKDMELDPDSKPAHAVQQKVADIIRMAFLASTSSVIDLCVAGLRLIDQILTIFGSMPDPDFSEALLLEQYQAQISSALTPAFGAESSPDLASAAVSVCATFISTGLVTDVDRMGRILKLLVSSLESLNSESKDTTVGDLRGLSTNAQTMIRMAVLSAWAELQVASTDQAYLVTLMEPHIAKLTPLWLSSLQEFARLRFEPDISSSTVSTRTDEGLDTTYAALNRQTLLQFYQDSWLKLVNAIASLINQDSNLVFDALDEKSNRGEANGVADRETSINYRDEPVAFFFVLFGISIEALVTGPNKDSSRHEPQTLEILSALKKILRPSVSGNAIYQDVVFSETIELFDRLALTESLDVQHIIVEIARNLCLTHPSAKGDEEDEEDSEHLSDDIEQLFELTRIIVLILTTVLPNLAEQAPSARQQQLPDEAVALVAVSLEALADASDIFPSVIKTDLHASILHIFATIFGTGACQTVVVPQALPIFKRFVKSIIPTFPSAPSKATANQIHGLLQRLLVIFAHAQRRESDFALHCAKNILLECTILLTTASSAFEPSHPLLIRCLDVMLDCLSDLGLGKIAAGCLRSILLTSPKAPTDEAIARHLFLPLVRFTLDSGPDPENSRSLVAHALTSFATTLPTTANRELSSSSSSSSNPTAAAFSILIPMLLTRARADPNAMLSLFPETATRLLELAGADPTGFRNAVAGMSRDQKGFMEEVLKTGAAWAQSRKGEAGEGNEGASGEPSIALKMTFGGG